MKNKKMMMALAITLMAIGFASVSTVLYLNGQTFVASNTGDFDVYYSKAVENGTDKTDEVIKDKKHIEFTTELTGIDDNYVLDYDVTNASKQYDANLVMNCVGGNEYLRVENKFDTTEILPARTTRSGRLTLTVIKAPLTEMSVSISCEISGNAVERDAAGGDVIESEKDYLAMTIPIKALGQLEQEWSQSVEKVFFTKKYGEYYKHAVEIEKGYSIACANGQQESEACQNFWKEYNEKQKEISEWKEQVKGKTTLWSGLVELMIAEGKLKSIEKITFTTSKKVPSNAVFSWDVSNSQNGSIMAWLLDEDNNDIYEAYIGQDGGVKANPDSSFLFYDLGVKEITGLENLDISDVNSMAYMFSCTQIEELDLSMWDTSDVTNMTYLFGGETDDSFTKFKNINLTGWNTGNVTNMSHMFSYCYELTELDLSHFDTSKVTDMSFMFYRSKGLINLNVGNFNTSQVTDMSGMFQSCSSLASLNVSEWNTINVTDMTNMFCDCNATYDVSKWNTSNVEPGKEHNNCNPT